MQLECSVDRPWGVHETVRNDGDCARCGWTAPGPIGDAIADAKAAAEELAVLALARGWAAASDSLDSPALAA